MYISRVLGRAPSKMSVLVSFAKLPRLTVFGEGERHGTASSIRHHQVHGYYDTDDERTIG